MNDIPDEKISVETASSKNTWKGTSMSEVLCITSSKTDITIHWHTRLKFLLKFFLFWSLRVLNNCNWSWGFFGVYLIPWYIRDTMLLFNLAVKQVRLKKWGPGLLHLSIIKNLNVRLRFLWASDVCLKNTSALGVWWSKFLAPEGIESLMNFYLQKIGVWRRCDLRWLFIGWFRSCWTWSSSHNFGRDYCIVKGAVWISTEVEPALAADNLVALENVATEDFFPVECGGMRRFLGNNK